MLVTKFKIANGKKQGIGFYSFPYSIAKNGVKHWWDYTLFGKFNWKIRGLGLMINGKYLILTFYTK